MLSLYFKDKDLIIKDMEKDQLGKITEWLNNKAHLRYAMGIDKPVDIEDLYEKYLEALVNTNEFFLSINVNEVFTGFIKGRVDYRFMGQIWIMSMIIDEQYQNKGIGKRVLDLLIDSFKNKFGIMDFYTMIVNDDGEGKAFWEKNNFKDYRLTEGYFTIDNKSYDMLIMHRQCNI